MSAAAADRIGPPLTNDAHWLKFVQVLKKLGLDEPIISQLCGFRASHQTLVLLEEKLRKSYEINEFWYDHDAEIMWACDEGGDTLFEALYKLTGVSR